MKTLIIVFIAFAILSQVSAQEIITMQGKHYYYGPGGRIFNSEIKELINTTGDSRAIQYYSNYETGKIVGFGALALGAVLNIVGASKAEKDFWGDPEIHELQVAGTVLYGVGIIALIVKRQSLKNAVRRFNSVQKEPKLDLGITRNGIGMTLKF